MLSELRVTAIINMMNEPHFVEQLPKVLNKEEYEQVLQGVKELGLMSCIFCPCYYLEKLEKVEETEEGMTGLTGKIKCTLGQDLTEILKNGKTTNINCPLRKVKDG